MTVILLLIRWLRRDIACVRHDVSSVKNTVFNLAREVSELRGRFDMLLNLVQVCCRCSVDPQHDNDNKCCTDKTQ